MKTGIKISGSSKGAARVPRPPKESDESRYRGRVGKAVRARREALKLTPDDLATKLTKLGSEVTAKAIYAYETGDRPIHLDDLPAFAKALKTTIHELLPKS